MSFENLNQIYTNENTSTKQDLSNQIDDIINKYKTQLDLLKTNTSKRNNSFNFDSGQSKTLKNDISPNLSKEIQNDNIKLQSLLTEEKLKTTKLKAQIEFYENELNKTKQDLNELNQIIKKNEEEYNQKMNEIDSKINDEMNERNDIINENMLNKNIIQNFFELYNKYIDIFYKSKIISLNNTQKLNYLNNNSSENKHQLAVFVMNNFDILIQKLLQDNKELYEQLIEVKKIMEQQNIIQKELETMKGIKEDNLVLKEQIKQLMNDNNILKNDNYKLKNNLVELNNYISNRLDNSNYNKQFKRNISNDNYLINYGNQRMNSYSQNNLFHNVNTNNNYNKINNHEHYIKNRKEYNKTSNNHRNLNYNINNKKKLTINGINTISSNKLNIPHNNKFYSKTDENRNINNNLEENKYINNNTYTSNKNINNRVFSGFENPIEKLKKKIMILEQQIKNNPE